MEHSTSLDTAELMHLALHAIQNDKPDKAISYLKCLLEMEPENGKAKYLIGALHAEIGMFDRAVEEMTKAVELEPNLSTARFQLGLLHLTAGRIAEAEAVWDALDVIGDQEPLFLFKKGMLHLVKDEFEQCIRALKSGIELNTLNEDLNKDMRRVLRDVEQVMERNSTGIDQKSVEDNAGEGQRMLLSLYETEDDDE